MGIPRVRLKGKVTAKAMNLTLVGGISKSLFNITAKIPKTKKSKLGLVRLLRRRFKKSNI